MERNNDHLHLSPPKGVSKAMDEQHKVRLVTRPKKKRKTWTTISGKVTQEAPLLNIYPTRAGRHAWMDGIGTHQEGHRRKQFDRERAKAKAGRRMRVANARRRRK